MRRGLIGAALNIAPIVFRQGTLGSLFDVESRYWEMGCFSAALWVDLNAPSDRGRRNAAPYRSNFAALPYRSEYSRSYA